MTENAVPLVTLNNGIEIPQLGFGVFRVDPASQKERRGFPDFLLQLRWILVNGDGMQVDNAENAFVIPLNGDPILEGA